MATLKFAKVEALPETLTANMMYMKQEGAAFALHVSDKDGAELLPLAGFGGTPVPQMLVSDTNWNPIEQPVYARSTPETALFKLGGHYDKPGAAGRHYQWGLSSWMSNPGTAPITVGDFTAQGWKVRGVGATSRQCGDDGDGHALEIITGQIKAECNAATVSGSAVLTVTEVTSEGSRFCVGNAISGTNIPLAATIVSITKGGQTVTHDQLLSADVLSAGTGYVVGEIVTLIGGTNTYPATMEVLQVNGTGGIIEAVVVDYGNYSAHPSEPIAVGGGSGTGAEFDTAVWINGGFGNPDTITISANATGTGTVSIDVIGPNNQNIGLLITGSGSGGADGKGNGNGRGIQFQAYGEAAFYRGIVFGTSSIRADGIGIEFINTSAGRGIMFGTGNVMTECIEVDGAAVSGSIMRVENTAATYGIRFTNTNTFPLGAIRLEGQDIRSDTTTGMKIGGATTEKIGFWGRTPIVRPGFIAAPTGGATTDTEARASINSIRNLLISMGVMAPS